MPLLSAPGHVVSRVQSPGALRSLKRRSTRELRYGRRVSSVTLSQKLIRATASVWDSVLCRIEEG